MGGQNEKKNDLVLGSCRNIRNIMALASREGGYAPLETRTIVEINLQSYENLQRLFEWNVRKNIEIAYNEGIVFVNFPLRHCVEELEHQTK